jgi:hypothetical protein
MKNLLKALVAAGALTSAALPLAAGAAAASALPAGYNAFVINNDGMCLNVYGDSGAVGAAIDQWTCDGGANQQFLLVSSGNGYYQLQAKNSGQDVAVTSDAAGVPDIVQGPPTQASTSLWLPVQQSNGSYSLQNEASGLCMDVPGATSILGQQLDQWACKNAAGTNQDFAIGTTAVQCSSPTTAQYFSRWGDANDYFLAPGGNFHASNPAPWTFSGGAKDVASGDPWNVTGDPNLGSAYLPPGGSVASGPMCVNATQTAVRFFYDSPGVKNSDLFVDIQVSSGINTATNTVEVAGGTGGWAVSQLVNLPAMYNTAGQETVSISFSPTSAQATWQVDGVMIDPFASL